MYPDCILMYPELMILTYLKPSTPGYEEYIRIHYNADHGPCISCQT